MIIKSIKTKFYISLSHLVRLLLLFIFIFLYSDITAQTKTKKRIDIQDADLLLYDQTVVNNAQRLIGNVKLSHQNMIMFCDSAWSYSNSNSVDAFGSVHIISNDTLHMWANFINYNGDSGIAKARGGVTLKDPGLTLTTDSLDFDMKEEIGYYNNGGKIVDSTNTLTSIIGRYYTSKNELFFTREVVLVNKDYTINTDTMIYNTSTETASFESPTTIVGTDTYFYTEKGWFNTKTNESEMVKKSTIKKEQTQLQADYIFYNDSTGVGIAKKNVIINDFENKMIICGNEAKYNDFSKYATITDSAMWVQYYENDSLFLHADTLSTMPDTSATDQKILTTYNKVRFFRDDIQGICDSLVYFTKDSLIQMYSDPVLWSKENQMTADFIELVSDTPPPSEVLLKNNAFLIQEIDSAKYNQIKGKNMIGLINKNQLYRIDVSGNGQSIYYPADEESIIGMNKAESSNIILYLGENQIKRITFVGSPKGTLNPILETVPAETQLDGFKWRGDDRPINKFDIFGNNSDKKALPETLPNSSIENILPKIQNKEKRKEAIE